MVSRLLVALWITIVVLPPIRDAAADSWSQYRRDARRSAATDEQLNSIVGIRWKRGFAEWPSVHAELAIVDGRVFFANMDGVISALDGSTGALIWSFDTGAAIATTPIVEQGKVFVLNLRGRLVALDAATGVVLWEQSAGADVYANGVLADGKIFLGTVTGRILAFSTGGQRLWSRELGAMIDSAPCAMNGRVFFAAENMKLFAFQASDGEPLWSTPLPGARTWNGDPLCISAADQILFTSIVEFEQSTSTYREVFDMQWFTLHPTLGELASAADAFISQNRSRLQATEIVNASTGAPVRGFTVRPANIPVQAYFGTSWYWSSIRPALWQGREVFFQNFNRNMLINLAARTIYQRTAGGSAEGHFVRGDEAVPYSIGGNLVYGGIGQNISVYDLRTGERRNLLGTYGSEAADFTPLTAPLSSSHYLTLPGDGGTDRIGTFIVASGRGYYVQYGWIYCFDGVLEKKNGGAPSAPTTLRVSSAASAPQFTTKEKP